MKARVLAGIIGVSFEQDSRRSGENGLVDGDSSEVSRFRWSGQPSGQDSSAGDGQLGYGPPCCAWGQAGGWCAGSSAAGVACTTGSARWSACPASCCRTCCANSCAGRPSCGSCDRCFPSCYAGSAGQAVRVWIAREPGTCPFGPPGRCLACASRTTRISGSTGAEAWTTGLRFASSASCAASAVETRSRNSPPGAANGAVAGRGRRVQRGARPDWIGFPS